VSLRQRLVLALLGLVAVGLVVVDLVTFTELHSYLFAQLDQQLVSEAQPVFRVLEHEDFPNGDPGIAAGTFGAILGPGGQIFARVAFTDSTDPRLPPEPRLPPALPGSSRSDDDGTRILSTGSIGGSSFSYRLLAEPIGGGGTLVVAIPLSTVEGTLGHLQLVEVVVTLGILLLILVFSGLIVGLGLRPLERIEETAEAIAAGDLSRRIEETGARTEVGRLSTSLNTMLATIEHAFAEERASEERLRRFVGDASHELRTPLTSIRGYAELFRRGAGSRPEDLAKAMTRIEEEAARMGLLVEDLLLLARLDQGRPLEQAPVDLAVVAADAVSDARAVEPARPIELETEGSCVVIGDDARLRQAVANLVTNALQHTATGTEIRVRLRGWDATQGTRHAAEEKLSPAEGPAVGALGMGDRPQAELDRAEAKSGEQREVVLEVADHGQGMTPEECGRVFERFYRADPARARASGGSGLGLSIVAAIVSAHGGSATVSSTVGKGSTFRLSLPGCPVGAPDAASSARIAELEAQEPRAGPDGSETGFERER